VDIETIRNLVLRNRYLVKQHSLQHGLKEGFGPSHIVEAIHSGRIIEEYPDDYRALVCGQATLEDGLAAYVHVVCEINDPDQVEFVTAYIPVEAEWEKPPFKRKKRR